MSIDSSSTLPTIVNEILDSLTEFADAIDASDGLGGRFEWQRVKMISEPEAYAFDQDADNYCERGNSDEPE